jgi:hypothetical protein
MVRLDREEVKYRAILKHDDWRKGRHFATGNPSLIDWRAHTPSR